MKLLISLMVLLTSFFAFADGPFTIYGEVYGLHEAKPNYSIFTSQGEYEVVQVSTRLESPKKALEHFVGQIVKAQVNLVGLPKDKMVILDDVSLAPPLPKEGRIRLPLYCGTGDDQITFKKEAPYKMKLVAEDYWGRCDKIRDISNTKESAMCLTNKLIDDNQGMITVQVHLDDKKQFVADVSVNYGPAQKTLPCSNEKK